MQAFFFKAMQGDSIYFTSHASENEIQMNFYLFRLTAMCRSGQGFAPAGANPCPALRKQIAPCRFLRRCLKNKCCRPEMRKKLLDNRAEICYNHSRWYGIRTIGAVGSASA